MTGVVPVSKRAGALPGRRGRIRAAGAAGVTLALLLSAPVVAWSEGRVDLERGHLLYDNHCAVCHDSRVHIRENRRARSLADIQGWVARWSSHLGLDWGARERAEVAHYLNTRYYGALPPQ